MRLVALTLLSCLAEACTRTPEGMVAIPPASYQMGCDPARDHDCGGDERPAHAVTVSGFFIDRTEVTHAAWAECVAAGQCDAPTGAAFAPSPLTPVTGISWPQARAYCLWRGKRLPSEAEWELAARGTDGRRFPWGDGDATCTLAHFSKCSDHPSDVGTHPSGASPFGVLDMAGNVDEWVDDVYRAYDAPAGAAAAGVQQRVARGGAWDWWHSRSTARNALQPEARDAWLGVRCARDR